MAPVADGDPATFRQSNRVHSRNRNEIASSRVHWEMHLPLSHSTAALTVILVGVGWVGYVAGAYVYENWWQPVDRLSDPEWAASANPQELLQVSRQVLRVPFADVHDACLFIATDGEAEDVELLIDALGRFEDTRPGDGVVCSKEHCLLALRTITGHDPGYNQADWRRWWLRHKALAP